MAGTTGLEPATSAVTGQRSDQLSYVPRLFFNNLVICHIESSVSQLSLFSLFSTISLLWTQFRASVDTTWTPRWTPKTATATTEISLSDEPDLVSSIPGVMSSSLASEISSPPCEQSGSVLLHSHSDTCLRSPETDHALLRAFDWTDTAHSVRYF